MIHHTEQHKTDSSLIIRRYNHNNRFNNLCDDAISFAQTTQTAAVHDDNAGWPESECYANGSEYWWSSFKCTGRPAKLSDRSDGSTGQYDDGQSTYVDDVRSTGQSYDDAGTASSSIESISNGSDRFGIRRIRERFHWRISSSSSAAMSGYVVSALN